MNYCAESKTVGSSRNENPDKKIETGLDSHQSRLLPYWHLYMKQTYQYILKGCTALHNEGNLVVRFVYSN